MITIFLIAIVFLPDIVRSIHKVKYMQQISVKKDKITNPLAYHQAEQTHQQQIQMMQAYQKALEIAIKAKQKQQQIETELEQLNNLREQYMQMLSELETQLQYTYSAKKRYTIENRLISVESKLMKLDNKRIKLWDAAHTIHHFI